MCRHRRMITIWEYMQNLHACLCCRCLAYPAAFPDCRGELLNLLHPYPGTYASLNRFSWSWECLVICRASLVVANVLSAWYAVDELPSKIEVYGKPPWFEAVKSEYEACRERVALLDYSSFTKLEVWVSSLGNVLGLGLSVCLLEQKVNLCYASIAFFSL